MLSKAIALTCLLFVLAAILLARAAIAADADDLAPSATNAASGSGHALRTVWRS